MLAYSNSFQGPYILDDTQSIPQNPHIRSLWPIWKAASGPYQQSTVSGRPLLSLSLALNYQISGLDVWSYHALNLLVHIFASLTLFGIVRCTLLSKALRENFGRASRPLAMICALVWLLHPIQTESVTYIIQRAESLMGLFYMLTLYCAIRGFDSQRSGCWYFAAISSCALGMATKEVMVTAPIIVLLYDRTFSARSFKEAFRRHWVLYAGLACSWILLAAIVHTGARSETVGIGFEHLSPLDYAKTQCNVIIHYLRLCLWPRPLVFDYTGWPISRNFVDYAIPGALIVVMLIGTVSALVRRGSWGFLGAWFFLILGPSSSFVPILDMAFEHRIYLSLAAVVVALVICAFLLGRWLDSKLSSRRAIPTKAIGYILATATIFILGLLTYQRNCDYRSAIAIWQDSYNKRPNNTRALNNLGNAYLEQGNVDEAYRCFLNVLSIYEDHLYAHNNIGFILIKQGNLDQAARHISRAIIIYPKYAPAHNNMGMVLAKQDKLDQAVVHFLKAVAIDPENPRAQANLATAFAKQGKLENAAIHFRKVLELGDDSGRTHLKLAEVLFRQRKAQLAVKHCREALKAGCQDTALLNNVAWMLATHEDSLLRDGAEAVRLAERACDLTDYKSPAMLDTLAAAYAEAGRFDQAVETAQRALQLARAAKSEKLAKDIQSRLELYKAERPYPESFSPEGVNRPQLK